MVKKAGYDWGYRSAQGAAASMGFAKGGEVKVKGYVRKCASGGAVKAVHKHEKALHPGKPLTKFK